MSQLPPAGGRLLQSLQSQMSPSTQQLFAGSAIVSAPQSSGASIPTTAQQADSHATDSFQLASPTSPHDLDPEIKTKIFEEILEEVEQGTPSSPQQAVVSALDPNAVYQPSQDAGIFAHAVPLAVEQAQDEMQQDQDLQQAQIGGRQKETLEGGGFVASAELPGDIQYIEEEPNPEIAPEVESYIQHVAEQAKTEPQTVVVAQDAVPTADGQPTPPRIVRVLPITKAQEEVGMRKNTSFSIRWLVEFGRKLANALHGQVIYRQD